MFCEKCGKELPEGATFCNQCGSKIEELKEMDMKEEKNDKVDDHVKSKDINLFIQKLKEDKSLQKKFGAVVGAIVLVCILLFVFLGGRSTNLEEYLIVDEITGINEFGYIEASLDWDRLYADLYGEANFDEDSLAGFQQAYEYDKQLDKLKDSIVIKIENNGNLSNGDQVKIVADFDENKKETIGKSLSDGEMSYEVEGLKNGVKLDLFDEKFIEVTYSGVSGSAKIDVDMKDFGRPWTIIDDHVEYTFDKSENISNGDKIVITATIDGDSYDNVISRLSNDGYGVAKVQTKEVEVKGLIENIKPTDITDEGIEEAKKKAMECFKKENPEYSKYKNVKIAGVYFYDKIDKSEPYKNAYNGIKFYNSLNVMITYSEDTFFGTYDRTIRIVFCDVRVENGKVILSEPKMDSDFSTEILDDKGIKEHYFYDVGNYTVTKLK